MNKVILSITGPSCSGKTTLASFLVNRFNFSETLSCTTREARDGEENGVHYDFVSLADMQSKIANNQLIEHASYGDQIYGTPADTINSILENGLIPTMVIDPKGVNQISQFAKQSDMTLVSVFVTNSHEVLTSRLSDRFKDGSDEGLAKYGNRLDQMLTTESSWAKDADYTLRFSEFNENNTEIVIETVLSH